MHARRIRVKRFPKRKKGALLVYVAQCMLHFFLPFTIHYKCMSSCENSPRVGPIFKKIIAVKCTQIVTLVGLSSTKVLRFTESLLFIVYTVV